VTVRTYDSPAAFKEALEHRIRARTPKGTIVARTRQLLVFDRFLARIVEVFGDAATLKGGVALELRLDRARTTKDVDLRLMGSSDDVLARLQRAARHDLGDFMMYEIVPDAEHPEIEAGGMKYEGRRFRAECRLAGKLYGQRFGVDVAFGDPIFGEPESLVAENVLGFAGIAPPTLRVYPLETHIAEKLHVYTLPRKRPNSRVKDLPDLGLLAGSRSIEVVRLRGALEQTFAFRATHQIPLTLPEPPAAWQAPYAALARGDQLTWPTLQEVFAAARGFLDPVLAGKAGLTWDPGTWTWSAEARR
jgi:predicted nucleotidyltransferase component of viral defense system